MDGFPGLSGLGYWMMRRLVLVNQLVTNIDRQGCRRKSISAVFRSAGIYGSHRTLTSQPAGNDTNPPASSTAPGKTQSGPVKNLNVKQIRRAKKTTFGIGKSPGSAITG